MPCVFYQRYIEQGRKSAIFHRSTIIRIDAFDVGMEGQFEMIGLRVCDEVVVAM